MIRNGLEPWHLILVLAVVLLLFGSKRMPEAARGLGRSLRIFKAEVATMNDEFSGTSTPSAAPTAAPTAAPAPSAATDVDQTSDSSERP